ncbi:MAG: DUF3786 domain-containing protein [Desulforhopalus sp.]
MTEIIDKTYFTALTAANPEILCRQGRSKYSEDAHEYALEVWGNRYLVDLTNSELRYGDTKGPRLHEYLGLFAVYYLLLEKDVVLSGEWISEKDLPGGSAFFRGPHLIPTDLISNRFNNDINRFKTICKKLGGTPLDMADAAFRFSITSDIPVAVLYWIGDEDFPAEAKILYDRSIAELLSLDILFALAVGVCARISTAFDKQEGDYR